MIKNFSIASLVAKRQLPISKHLEVVIFVAASVLDRAMSSMPEDMAGKGHGETVTAGSTNFGKWSGDILAVFTNDFDRPVTLQVSTTDVSKEEVEGDGQSRDGHSLEVSGAFRDAPSGASASDGEVVLAVGDACSLRLVLTSAEAPTEKVTEVTCDVTIIPDGLSQIELKLKANRPTFVTDKPRTPTPEIEALRLAPLSRGNSDDELLELAVLKVSLPDAPLKYLIDRLEWMTEVQWANPLNTGAPLLLKKQDGTDDLSDRAQQARPESLNKDTHELKSGQDVEYRILSRIGDLRAMFASNADNLSCMLSATVTPASKPAIGKATPATANVELVLKRRLGELATLHFDNGASVSPHFVPSAESLMAESAEASVMLSDDDEHPDDVLNVEPYDGAEIIGNPFVEIRPHDGINIKDFELESRKDGGYYITKKNKKCLAEKAVYSANLIVELKDDKGSHFRASVRLNIQHVRIQPKYLVCVDFGSSATAVLFGNMALANPMSELLPLGQVVGLIGGEHDECSSAQLRLEPSRAPKLIPSSMQLHPDHDWRAIQDRHSLPVGATASDRVSFPAIRKRSEGRAVYESHLESDTKRAMLRNLWKPNFPGSKLDRKDLLFKAFRELGEYIVPNALQARHEADTDANRREGLTLRNLWLDAAPEDVQIVITHPFNARDRVKSAYEDAAKEFARAFIGEGGLKPILVPEAMAAALYGIFDARSSKNDVARTAKTFACIDIGAGTFDASVMTRDGRQGSADSWNCKVHFGAMVGGVVLDEALADWVDGLVDSAIATAGEAGRILSLERALGSESWSVKLKREILNARKALSEEKLAQSRGDAPVADWSAQAEWTLKVRGLLKTRSRALPLGVHTLQGDDARGARLLVEQGKGNAQSDGNITLEIPLKAFTGRPASPDVLEPRAFVQLVGAVVPAMLVREARRRKVPDLEDMQWIVTGRTGLWPPLFAAVIASVRALNAGRMANPTPFDAETMKSAIVLGAAEFARKRENHTIEVDAAPLAAVEYSTPRGDGLGENRSRLMHVKYYDVPGSDWCLLEDVPNDSALCQCLPGLDEAFPSNLGVDCDEAKRLFEAYDQKLTWDESDRWVIGPGNYLWEVRQHEGKVQRRQRSALLPDATTVQQDRSEVSTSSIRPVVEGRK